MLLPPGPNGSVLLSTVGGGPSVDWLPGGCGVDWVVVLSVAG